MKVKNKDKKKKDQSSTVKTRYKKFKAFITPIIVPIICIAAVVSSFIYLVQNHVSNRVVASFENRYKIGDLVNDNVYAPVSITYIDEEETETLRNKKVALSTPIFTRSFIKTQNNIVRANTVFDTFSLDETNAKNSFSKMDFIVSDKIINNVYSKTESWRRVFVQLGKEVANKIISDGLFDNTELYDMSRSGFKTIVVYEDDTYDMRMVDKVYKSIPFCYTPQRLKEQIAPFFMQYHGPYGDDEMRDIISLLISDIILPNVEYNREATNIYFQEVKESVPNVVVEIKKGDLIVQKDTVVTTKTISLLSKISEGSARYTTIQRIVIIIFIVATLLTAYLILNIWLKDNDRKKLYMNLFFISLALYIIILSVAQPLLSFIKIATYDLLIPMFIVPLMLSLLTGNKKIGYLAAGTVAAILEFFPFSGIYSVIRYFLSGVLSVTFIYYTNSRMEKMMNYLLVLVLEQFVSIITLALEGFVFIGVLKGVFASGVVFIIGQVFVVLSCVLFEKAFNLPTVNRLYELINKKTPLLERFEQLCPGSYDHVMSVQKIAEAASDALNLNTPLVKLASLYHDVGKMEHPQYFIENQTEGNKHDVISAELSVAMIRSHVTLGVRLAKEAHLPQEVIDIIAEHHGNDTINYFYYEALHNKEISGGQKEDVNESDFAYTAEPPKTKEAALVMLADISEAAVRSVKKARIMKGEDINESVIRKTIHSLFMAKIEKHQLQNCNLSLAEMMTIEDVFTAKLEGVHHSRIEYKKNTNDDKGDTK